MLVTVHPANNSQSVVIAFQLVIPIEVWNISKRTSSGVTRTTNSLEGFHNASQNSISCQHPNIWKILNALKLKLIFAQKEKKELEQRVQVTSKQVYKECSKRLITLLEKCDPCQKMSFLKAVSYNLY